MSTEVCTWWNSRCSFGHSCPQYVRSQVLELCRTGECNLDTPYPQWTTCINKNLGQQMPSNVFQETVSAFKRMHAKPYDTLPGGSSQNIVINPLSATWCHRDGLQGPSLGVALGVYPLLFHLTLHFTGSGLEQPTWCLHSVSSRDTELACSLMPLGG